MPIICSICQEELTQRPQILTENSPAHCVALKCGHLFHEVCVRHWFGGSAAWRPEDNFKEKNCPCCNTRTCMQHSLKIFPTSDEDGNNTRMLEDVNAQIEQLNQELQEMQGRLAAKQAQLDRELEESDNLRIAHAETLSKLDEMQKRLDEVQESMELGVAVQNSAKSAMKDTEERAEKEKRDFLRRIKELEESIESLTGRKSNDVTIFEIPNTENTRTRRSSITGGDLRNRIMNFTVASTDDEEDDIVPIFSSTRICAD